MSNSKVRKTFLGWSFLAVVMPLSGNASAEKAPDSALVQRGEYLIRISGCNDCHTPGYPQADGKIPAGEWLTGNPVGFSGPWGTTYPANLRLLAQTVSEQDWITKVRGPMRPPMPWFSLRDMKDEDLRAIYAFVRSLGGKGQPAPAYAPPGEKVATPFIEFVPKNLPQQQAKK